MMDHGKISKLGHVKKIHAFWLPLLFLLNEKKGGSLDTRDQSAYERMAKTSLKMEQETKLQTSPINAFLLWSSKNHVMMDPPGLSLVTGAGLQRREDYSGELGETETQWIEKKTNKKKKNGGDGGRSPVRDLTRAADAFLFLQAFDSKHDYFSLPYLRLSWSDGIGFM
ncbi:unnamed protein product [Musa banksii]